MKKSRLNQLFDAIENKSSPAVPGSSFDESVLRAIRQNAMARRRETGISVWLTLAERHFIPIAIGITAIALAFLLVEGVYVINEKNDLELLFDAFVQQQIGI